MLKINGAMMYIVIAFAISVCSTDAHTYFEKWQCYIPRMSSLYNVVNKRTKQSFNVIGHSEWMNEERTYVSCYEAGLMMIPRGLQATVEMLNLNKNLITYLQNNAFENYQSLVAILLAENCVTYNLYNSIVPKCSSPFLKFSSQAFTKLKKLKYLDLSGNSLINLPGYLPESLIALNVHFTSVRPFNSTQFSNLTNLQLALLPSNCVGGDLKHLCKGNFTVNNLVFSSNNLSFLDLSYNNMHQFPKWLLTSTLVGIKLRGNPIKTVYAHNFQNCKSLIYIEFSWTSQYDKVPLTLQAGSFDGLHNLKYLDLSGNMISSLPHGFLAKSLKLETLKLAFNCLKSWVVNPIGLPYMALKYLDLAGNTFCTNKSVPEKTTFSKLELGKAYKNFSHLETLLLGAPINAESHVLEKMVTYGPIYFKIDKQSLKILQFLPHLKIFSLSLTGIRALDMKAFCGRTFADLNLGINEIGLGLKLNVKHNRMKRDTTVKSSHKIKFHPTNFDVGNGKYFSRLHLQRNAIVNLQEYPFNCFTSTTYLDLSNNRINYIHSHTFQPLFHLQVLDLQYNPIKHIDSNAFTSLANLNLLSFNFTDFQEQYTLVVLYAPKEVN